MLLTSNPKLNKPFNFVPQHNFDITFEGVKLFYTKCIIIANVNIKKNI